jgi:hypothetical protein
MSSTQNHTHSKLRIPLLVAGVLTGVLALGLLVAGGGLLWADGQKDGRGYLSTDRHAFQADTAALVSENVDLDLDGAEWLVDAGDFGDVRLSVAPESSTPVFVGIARTSDVDRYLAGIAHTTVDDLDDEPFGLFGDFGVDYRDSAGVARAGRPADETFWAASASGTGVQDLSWDARHGDWSIVVMNADGSPGVNAGVQAGAKLPLLDELGWTALGGGVILMIITAGLVTLGVRPRRPRTGSPATATHAAPAA